MNNSKTKLIFSNLSLVLAVVFAALVASPANAEDDDRFADYLWPEGKDHTTDVWANGNISATDSEEKGPIQGPAEELCLRRTNAPEADGQDLSNRTIVFFVAQDRRTGRKFVVVPGFKVGEPSVNEAGVPFMRVIRVSYREQLKVHRALVKVLAKRGLAKAPINFFLEPRGQSYRI